MRSDAYIRVYCDKCNGEYEEEVQLCAIVRSGWDERYVNSSLRQVGWRVEDGKDICPNCVSELECEEEEQYES